MPTDLPPTQGRSAAEPRRRFVGVAWAGAFVGAALGLRLLLGGLLPGLSVFSLFYPAILGAALVGGEAAAAVALGLSFGVSWALLSRMSPVGPAALAVNMLLYLGTGAFVGIVGSRLRFLLERRRDDLGRLAEREARYRALFEGVSEGVALLEAVWGEDGRLADFIVLDANPALLVMFQTDASIIGRRQSELYGSRDERYLAACEQAFRGRPAHLEVPSGRGRRWFDVHLSPVGPDRIAQLAVDITDRKVAESRRAEMFDELNHRVKNNLAAVSAMLSMQARNADHPEVSEHLRKAVDRIETISDVHASLYRTSSADEVDFSAYLDRLCQRLAETLLDSDRLRLEIRADPAMAPLDEAVALGLIVNELVTNAAKYAYPAPAAGIITVSLRQAPGELRLTVSDRGVGLPAGAPTGGIGMRLVRSLVQQCRGELEIGPPPGATFIVRLPRG